MAGLFFVFPNHLVSPFKAPKGGPPQMYLMAKAVYSELVSQKFVLRQASESSIWCFSESARMHRAPMFGHATGTLKKTSMQVDSSFFLFQILSDVGIFHQFTVRKFLDHEGMKVIRHCHTLLGTNISQQKSERKIHLPNCPTAWNYVSSWEWHERSKTSMMSSDRWTRHRKCGEGL